MGAFYGLSFFGIDTSSLVAGLGVGGLTVGLALQSTLKDMFGTAAIMADEPFKVREECRTE